MSAQSFISHYTFVQQDLNFEAEIGIEIISGQFKVELDEWNQSGKAIDAVEHPSQIGRVAPCGLLAAQLDLAGHAHGLSFLPALARLHSDGGRAGPEPDGHFHLDTLTPRIRAAL